MKNIPVINVPKIIYYALHPLSQEFSTFKETFQSPQSPATCQLHLHHTDIGFDLTFQPLKYTDTLTHTHTHRAFNLRFDWHQSFHNLSLGDQTNGPF